MSDLISRSELIEELKSLKIVLNGKQIFSDDAKDTVLRIVNEQATAYDVDKVVKELNELEVKAITRYKNGDFGDFDGVDYYIKKSKAIEIIKQGGVSDDVCEWKVFDNSLTDEPQWVYETTCGKYAGEEHTSKAFAYCPCCGKKIKIVGD